MIQPADILSIANRHPVMLEELETLQEREKQIPGTWQYKISRYRKQRQWNIDDVGMLVYHVKKNEPETNYLELKFCISGNVYCKQKDTECDNCRLGLSMKCEEKVPTLDVLNFRFEPGHLSQFVRGKRQQTLTEDVLKFKHISSFTKVLPLCSKIRITLEALLNNNYTDTLENIFVNAQTQILLLYSMECMLGNKENEEAFACKFLANEDDRDKIKKAREILLQHIGEPLTIKELSRKVAINECYLKKGFKEMFGTTIFDFYQNQRMEHARYLLYEKGLSVTEVSLMLGYSSISHFSTAFKRHTGLKPCELLIR
jgi:AraC family transcriptional regulator